MPPVRTSWIRLRRRSGTPDPIRIRVGVHTGEADLHDGGYYGTAVNLCARIRGLAEPNQVVLSEATSRLLMRSDTQVPLHEIGAYELKGLALPERVFALGEGTGPSDTDTRTSSTTGRRANPHERGSVATTENITVLFTDLVGSTELASSLTPEAGDEVRNKHFSALRQAIATSGGTEVKNLGDGLMVVFPAASAALACAVAMQQVVHHDNAGAYRPLGIRVGLSAGEATMEDGDYFGDPVIEAARLCAKCDSGQILAAEVVRILGGRRSSHTFTSLGELELKGLPDPIETLEVSWEPLDADAPGSGRVPLPTRLTQPPAVGVIGRENELALLDAAAKRVASGEGRELVFLAGEPGQGKTTLVSELSRHAHDKGMTVLLGRCDEEVGAPYRPFQEALSHLVAHVDEELLRTHVARHGGELARMVPAVGQRLGELPPSQTTDADTERYLLYAAVVGLLEEASQERPVLLFLDDLHWADKPSLQLLRHVIANTSAASS